MYPGRKDVNVMGLFGKKKRMKKAFSPEAPKITWVGNAPEHWPELRCQALDPGQPEH